MTANPTAAPQRATTEEPPMPDRGLHSPGMRDVGPAEMRRFRAVERRFLEAVEGAGYLEIRTPTIEPLHLYTAAGTLSPQALERVYSFLDWDGWSGERVVLRPDATVAAARWYSDAVRAGGAPTARVAYVAPVYRFAVEGDREVWQCGVELFGLAAAEGDSELLTLAAKFLRGLGVNDLTVDLAHAGLVRAAFAAAGLAPAQQVEAYDLMLEGDAGVTDRLAQAHPEQAASLRLLAGVDGASTGYIQNLRAAMLATVPAAAGPLDDLTRAAAALDAAAVPFRVLAATARNFEYYSGVTFRFRQGAGAEARTLIGGGRYDGLTQTLGGTSAPACGWGADLLRLAEVAS
ncbi:MAG: ATP phosphoribosyltransferase regulatory subunit [Dehalococcoidia bacterium]|nr:MAG: ATP phosphoribosyltransferase regulatory subunit [Dehalococcoidia bacterium]